MSKINSYNIAKLVVGFFLHNKSMVNLITEELKIIFGPIDMVSCWIPFDYTSYYYKEMSAPLFRRVFAFKYPFEQIDLAKIKIITNNIEQKYTKLENRLVNIDPGYILPERFVLATGKNYAHRICIGLGVYADLTLIYKNGSFCSLPWTYPDYRKGYLRNFLLLVRNKYLADIKRIKFNNINKVI